MESILDLRIDLEDPKITVLKKKLKQALLKLKTTKNELQQNAYELDSMKSKFAEYKDQSSKSLRIANNKVDNIKYIQKVT